MRRRFLAGLLLAGLLAGCGGPEQEVSSGSTTTAAAGAGWEQIPPSPLSPRGGAVLVTLDDGQLLVVGGDTAPGCHDTLMMPTRDAEASGASSGPAVVLTSNAGCIGPEKETRLRDGAILDLSSGEWRPVAEAPAPVADPTRGVVVGDITYFWAWPSVVQGAPQTGTWMAYDSGEDSWQRLADPPLGDQPYIGIVRHADQLIAFRTSEEYGPVADLVYDPGTNEWSELRRDPLSPSFDRFMVWAGGEVVLLARELVPNPGADGPSLVRAASLDPSTNAWRRLPDSEIIGGYETWWWSGDRVVNAARQTGDGGESGNYGRHYPHGGMLDPEAGEWSALPESSGSSTECEDGNESLSPDFGYHAAGSNAVVNDAWLLHVSERRWEPVPCNPPRADFAYSSAWAGGSLVTWGGYDAVAEPGEFPTDYKFRNDGWRWEP